MAKQKHLYQHFLKEREKEIEDYLYNKFLDYKEWNRLKNNR